MDEQFDIILETQGSLHLLVATSSARHLALLVAESLYTHTNAQPHEYKAKAVFVCDVTNPKQKQIIELWPLRDVEPEAHQAALLRLAAYQPFSEGYSNQ